jgi:amidase
MEEREYVELDGLELAERVRGGEVSAAEVLQVARARADRLNPAINAIATRLDERAAERATGALSGPFAGVPFC